MWCFKVSFLCWLVVCVIIFTEVSSDDDVKWANSSYENDTSIREFVISFSDEDIADLVTRLNNTRKGPTALSKFSYGVSLNTRDEWVTYWANSYNFTERLEYMNQYTHYTTNIQGLEIHFLWFKATATSDCTTVPLLLLHGPDSALEFYPSISSLTQSCVNGTSLDLVIPFLPGFGYSDSPTIAGFGAPEIATVMKNLMNRLNYTQFYVHSRDALHLGSVVATMYPVATLGYHSTFPLSFNPVSLAAWIAGSASPSTIVSAALEDRLYPLKDKIVPLLSASGYIHMIATKPQTIGVALIDVPASLLLFWLENSYWGASGASQDQMLDNISLAWFTKSITKAIKMFKETISLANIGYYADPTQVPTWVTEVKDDLYYQSPVQLKLKYQNLLNVEVTSNCTTNTDTTCEKDQYEVFSDSIFNAMNAFIQYHATNSM